MEVIWFILGSALLLAAIWFFTPYLSWRGASVQTLETHIAKTSFRYAPGELVPPAWKAPEVVLSIVVPAYNEEYRIPQMLDETLTYLEERATTGPPGFTYEVIVIDDGSTDATFAAAVAAGNREASCSQGEVRVVQLARNRGKGFAVRVGMLAARGQLLLMADADGATSIRDCARLEKELSPAGTEGGVQIVFGSRHHLKDEALAQRSFIRNVLMVGFHCCVWLMVGGNIHDTQCGFKLFRANVGKRIFASLHLFRWAFDIEIVVLAGIFCLRIAEVPVTWVEMPGSKLNLMTGAITMLRDIALVQILYGLGIWRPYATA